jgi:hypothetical protein
MFKLLLFFLEYTCELLIMLSHGAVNDIIALYKIQFTKAWGNYRRGKTLRVATILQYFSGIST